MPSIVTGGFINLSERSLYATVCLPDDNPCPSHWVIHCPAFAEEMNKSRKVVADQARAFANQGKAVVILDPWGTGDSPGAFSEADWTLWISDLRELLYKLPQYGAQSCTLWGLRLGCLLALEVEQHWHAEWPTLEHILLWQPVLSGQQFMTQFLRLRLASGLLEKANTNTQGLAQIEGKSTETVKELRQKLVDEGSLEVAGYLLPLGLVEQIDQKLLSGFQPSVSVHWLEVKSSQGAQLPPVSLKTVEAWLAQDVLVAAQVVQGESFWMTQELADAPRLIDASCQLLAAMPASVESSLATTHSILNQELLKFVTGCERAVSFSCQDDRLLAVLHAAPNAKKGILLVVGGPQYRVGSHRQFVMLARALADSGIAVFRFDYRGMGDSGGIYQGFESIGEDISAALDAFVQQQPEMRDVALWGLCDGATAAACFAHKDARIKGLVLLNPWVRTDAGEARAYLKHYYLQRLLEPEFWKKVRQGRFNVRESFVSLRSAVRRVWVNPEGSELEANTTSEQTQSLAPQGDLSSRTDLSSPMNLAAQMAEGLSQFEGQILFILSGVDLTAAEFKDTVKRSKDLTRVMAQTQCQIQHMADADHTFSRQHWKDQVAHLSCQWMQSW